MVSALVIKVKYGDSFRCFHSYVNENGLLDIDLDGLKARILSLFNLNPDANLVLTYIDEDKDNVALVDEEDFYYAVQQCLNPMRITARLDDHKRMRAREETGRSSRHSLSSIYTCFENFLKYVPKPLQGRTSEAFDYLMKGDASSIPEFSHIVEVLAKLKSGCQTIGASEVDLKVSGCSETSKDAKLKSGCQTIGASEIDLKASECLETSKCTKLKSGCQTIGASEIDLKVPKWSKTSKDAKLKSGCQAIGASEIDLKASKCSETSKDAKLKSGFQASGVSEIDLKASQCSETSKDAKLNSGCQTLGASEIDLQASECLETSKDTFSMQKKSLGDEYIAPIEKSYQQELNKGNINRNASTLHLDPASIHGVVKGVPKHDPIQQSPDQKFRTNPSSADVLRESLIRPRVTGLGSLLIPDISIKDRDKMRPSTSFTKIWRMCNNGMVVWPEDTQLVWIGGDKFTETVSVPIQASCGEVHMRDEVDIVVDFTTPEQPGWYSSYWRLALCTGHKFGQVVCVDIQVSTFTDDSKWNLGLKAAADKDKCFKKFKQKGNETKRDGFNLNNRRVASASDLGMDEKGSYMEWIYIHLRNHMKAQQMAKCLV